MAPLLTVERLAVTYGSGVRAVHDASLTVEEGELVALLGANGAGKTTLLRALSGLLDYHRGHVSAGRASAFGHDLIGLPGHARSRIGITQTFEGRRIFARFTVEENLEAGAIGASKALVRKRMDELYERFPILHGRRRQAAGLLSGGEQQILAIARALISDPRLLLFDEPSLGLAPIMMKQIAHTIRAVRELGKAVLLVEQNAHLALELADRAYVMQNGATVAEGPAETFKRQETMHQFYMGFREGSPPLRRRRPVEA